MIHLKQKNNCASAESYFDNKKQSIVFLLKILRNTAIVQSLQTSKKNALKIFHRNKIQKIIIK